MTSPAHLERRARRLARWYPRTWRDRYGDEFCAMLECELHDQPLSARRTLDVVMSGLLCRATRGGLAGLPRDGAAQARASLAWVAGSLCAFLAFGLAMWSQLVVSWQWTSPRSPSTMTATVVMSVCVAALLVLLVLAIAPVATALVTRLARGEGRRLYVPLVVFVAAVSVLAIGAHAFENGWPGTGGHHWAHQGMVPGGFAAFIWASTLGVTSYWAHPGALRTFPSSEVAWMACSPIAMLALGASSAAIVRRVELTERASRLELRVAQATSFVMAAFFVGACLWLSDSTLPRGLVAHQLFHVGVIDVVGVAVMAICLGCAYQATFRGLGAMRRRTVR